MTEQRFMTADETDRYIDERIARAMQKQRGGGCLFWGVVLIAFALFIAALLPNLVMSYPVLSQFAGRAGVTFSTAAVPPRNTLVLAPQEGDPASQGQEQPAHLVPFYGSPQPATEPTPTAEPALTIPVVPTPTKSFWSPEEETQIAQTATAFIEVIPTAPPEFAAYVDERCKDAGAVEESPTLQLFCKK